MSWFPAVPFNSSAGPVYNRPTVAKTWQNDPSPQMFVRPAVLVTVGDGATVFSADRREYVHEYHVWTRLRCDASLVKFCPGLPQEWSVYTYHCMGEDGVTPVTHVDRACVLVEITVRKKEDDPDKFCHWIVTCRYSTETPDTRLAYTDNPTRNPCRIEWEVETWTGPLEKDLDGRALLNSALQPFTPTPMFEQGRAVAVITNVMWANSVTAALLESWSFVCNEETFLGETQGRWLALPPKCDPFHVGNVLYYRMTRRLKLAATRQDGTKERWDTVDLLNKGVCRRQSDATKENFQQPVPIIGPGGPITQPQLLDADGQPLAGLTGQKQFGLAGVAGATVYSAFTIEPTYEKFRVRRLLKFADFFKNSYGEKQVVPTGDDPVWLTDPSQYPPSATSAVVNPTLPVTNVPKFP